MPHKNPFPFNTRPNTLDRDRIVVPAGWDSWGKIGVLRDGFDAQRRGEAKEAKKAVAKAAPSPAAKASGSPAAAPASGTKLSYKQKFALETLPKTIAGLEKDIAKLEADMADPQLFTRDPTRFGKPATTMDDKRGALAKAEDEWLELEMLKAEMEG